MTGWYAERTPDGSAKAVIAVMLLALLLVAAVPVALLAGVVMMLLGHVIGGLALFGGSIPAPPPPFAVPRIGGVRHLPHTGPARGLPLVPSDSHPFPRAPEP